MRSSTNMLIANMAFADLLMTIDIPYITKYVFVFNQWFGTFMGTVLCKFFHSAQVGSLAASVFSLVAISLDRSFAILFPMKTIMSQNVLRFTMAVVWLCALALTVPLALASTVRYVEGRDKFICTEAWGVMSYQAYITLGIFDRFLTTPPVFGHARTDLWVEYRPIPRWTLKRSGA